MEGNQKYFNPCSPHGERLRFVQHLVCALLFQSTLPARGATRARNAPNVHVEHFNPRSPHGERQCVHRVVRAADVISIHAPRTGSDLGFADCVLRVLKFQSTLPARGATKPLRREIRTIYFNPRSPHGERRRVIFFVNREGLISIHAPRTGSDTVLRRHFLPRIHFNPRSPHGERHAQAVSHRRG